MFCPKKLYRSLAKGLAENNFFYQDQHEVNTPICRHVSRIWMMASHLFDKLLRKSSYTFQLQSPEVSTSAKRLFQAPDLNLTLQFLLYLTNPFIPNDDPHVWLHFIVGDLKKQMYITISYLFTIIHQQMKH